MGRNHSIDFFKFLYSWVIVFYHFFSSKNGMFIGGYYGVEFYLLVAGVFLFSSFEKQSDRGNLMTPYQYFGHRFQRLFPWALTAFLFTAVIQRFFVEDVRSLETLLDYFSEDIWEILLVKWNGMNEGRLMVNGPAWTMSSMLLVGFVIWGCMYFFRRGFLYLLMPLTLIVGFGVWRHLPSGDTQAWIGFTAFGTFRAWLVMCLSYYCLLLAKRLRQIQLKPLGMWIMTFLECALHGLLLFIIFYKDTRYYQWFATLLFIVAIAIALAGKSYLGRLFDKLKIVPFLGEISLSIYLVHWILIDVYAFFCRRLGVEVYYEHVLPFMALVVVFALLHLYLTKWSMKLCKTVFHRLRTALIQQ